MQYRDRKRKSLKRRRIGYRCVCSHEKPVSVSSLRATQESEGSSRFQDFLRHPLTIVFVSFFLTILIGGYFTYHLNKKLKEYELFRSAQQMEVDHQRLVKQREFDLAREKREKNAEFRKNQEQIEKDRDRNFAYELNKIRIAKVVELWEHIDAFEENGVKYAVTLSKNFAPVSDIQEMFKYQLIKSQFEDSNPDYLKLLSFLNRNRFLIGDELFKKYSDYIQLSTDGILENSKPFFLEVRVNGQAAPHNDEPLVLKDGDPLKFSFHLRDVEMHQPLKQRRRALREDFFQLRDYIKRQ